MQPLKTFFARAKTYTSTRKYIVPAVLAAIVVIIGGVIALRSLQATQANKRNAAAVSKLDKEADTYTAAIAKYVAPLAPGDATNVLGNRTSVAGGYENAPKLINLAQAELSKKYQAAQKLEAAVTADRQAINELLDIYNNPDQKTASIKLLQLDGAFFSARSNAVFSTNRGILNSINNPDDTSFYDGQVGYYDAIAATAQTFKTGLSDIKNVPGSQQTRFKNLTVSLDNYSKTANDCKQSIQKIKSKTDIDAISDANADCKEKVNDSTFAVNRAVAIAQSYASYFTSDPLLLFLQQLKAHAAINYASVDASKERIAANVQVQNKLQAISSILPTVRSDQDQAFVVKSNIARVLVAEAQQYVASSKVAAKNELVQPLKVIANDLTLFDGFSSIKQSADDSGGYYGSLLASLLAANQRPSFELDKADRAQYQKDIAAATRKIKELQTPTYVQPEVTSVIGIYDQALALTKQYESLSRNGDSRTYVDAVRASHEAIGNKLNEAVPVLEIMADKLDDYPALRAAALANIATASNAATIR